MATLLDTNVLVHAAYHESPLFGPAALLVDRGLRQSGAFCIAPQNLVEFAAVVSRDRSVTAAMPPEDVLRISEVLFRSRSLAKIYPKRATVLRAMQVGAEMGLKGPHWYDMFLAETMRDAGVETIVTEDTRHFRRFSFLSAMNIRDAASEL